AWTRKTTVSAEPNTYRHRAPPGIGSSSASCMSARKPVRSSSQSASCLNKGDPLLALGAEPLELDAHFGIAPLDDLDLQPIHRARWDLVLRLPFQVEGTGVARAQEALAAGGQVDGTSQVGTL